MLRRKIVIRNFLVGITVLCVTISHHSYAQTSTKELYIPKDVWKVPKGNNFDDTSSKYNKSYMVESENMAIFWPKSFGKHPELNKDINTHFNPDSIIVQCERFYKTYVDTLKFVIPGKSISDKYKVLMIVCDDNDGTAYGGGSEENPKIGILWTPTSRISHAPYGAIAHELGHVFQTFVSTDGGVGFSTAGQTMYEMTSQYMLWQTYPLWMTFENYHLKDFVKQSNLAFLHPDNQYHSPYILEYWSGKHGRDFIGKLWRNAQKGEDAVDTYKRLNHLSQSAFNDEIFDADRHLIGWDLNRVRDLAKPYANLFSTKLDTLDNGWLSIDSSNRPQNYGFNVINIPLENLHNNNVSLQFDGGKNASVTGWRYGFVMQSRSGKYSYGKVWQKDVSKIKYKIPGNTTSLWLVVMVAPHKHVTMIMGKDKPSFTSYPYKILIK